MDSRKIQYADPEEDILQIEVDIALNRTMEENFKAYFLQKLKASLSKKKRKG